MGSATDRPAATAPIAAIAAREVKTTCCYSGVGCGVMVKTDGAVIVGVRGDRSMVYQERLTNK